MKLLFCVDKAYGWLPTCLPNCLDKYQWNKDDLVWESGSNETDYLSSVWPVYIMIGPVIKYHLSFSEIYNNKKCHYFQLFVSFILNHRLPLSWYERCRAISDGLHLASKGTAVCGLDLKCWWLRASCINEQIPRQKITRWLLSVQEWVYLERLHKDKRITEKYQQLPILSIHEKYGHGPRTKSLSWILIMTLI